MKPQLSSVALFLLLSLPLTGREWINQQGLKIEAAFVSCDGSTAVLKRDGKEIKYPVTKLSATDQAFIKEQMEAKPAASEVPTGWIHDFPIAKPAFAEAKLYLAGRNAKSVYQAFDKGSFPPDWDTNKKDAEAEFAYDVATAQAHVYIPATYDGSKPFGVYLHISYSEGGANLPAYAPVMDHLNLIFISPKGASNKQPMLRRVRLAVDALSSVKATYRIDEKRVCVGGTSGGGHMCMLTHAMFPEIFMGSVSHAAQSYMPSDNSCGHFPGLSVRDLKSGDLKTHKWCVISGDKDKNYAEIQKTTKIWEANRMNYKFFDVPGMAHQEAPPEKFEEALKWIGL